MENQVSFAESSFGKRLKSMLRVDFKRMLRSKLFYIIIACSLLVPIIMTVMMSMMDGTTSIDQQTGQTVVIEGPDNTWQSIGTLPTEGGAQMGGMDVMAMCNINMAFMGVAVFVCLFICDDFRSGYAKNLFTVRAKKTDYVISKTLAGLTCGAAMIIAYLFGAILGGAISGLSFELVGFSGANLTMCIISKLLLMAVFVPIFVLWSIAAKQKSWLAICGSLASGMLLFMTVGLITPLNATLLNAALCLGGGAMFSFGLGAISNKVLCKTSLV